MTFSGEAAIAHGDVLACLKDLPSNEFDALLCDPPYGFSFMGKKWDYDVPSVDVWREALRVLKPGAPLLAFGGARTFHRICVGIEDAGFELRDVLHWLYGKGFPKSQDVSKAIDNAAGAKRTEVLREGVKAGSSPDRGVYQPGLNAGFQTRELLAPVTAAAAWQGYGTALKPAYEPIILARKPLEGTMASNVASWGVGGLNVDGCRIEGESTRRKSTAANSYMSAAIGAKQTVGAAHETGSDAGRWPANLILDEHAGAALGDEKRFFYSSKVSTKEREYGCEALPQRVAEETHGRAQGSAGLDNPRSGATGQTGGARNHHPTLKPLSLTSWLAKLILPPGDGAQLLVPFSGAGSEVIGALQAGWPLVFGIEGEAEYIAIAEARIAAWRGR